MDSKELNDTGLKPDIKDVYYLETIEQLQAISDPIRYRMVDMMTTAKTGAQLARALGISRARAHYHLKLLEKVGIVKFCGEGMSHGIVEKYYHTVARLLDFSKLLSNERKDLLPDENMFQAFHAVTGFLTTMLDASKESVLNFEKQKSLETSSFFDYVSVLTPDQVKLVKQELTSLRQRIIEMSRENEINPSSIPSSLLKIRATFFLTTLLEIHKEEV